MSKWQRLESVSHDVDGSLSAVVQFETQKEADHFTARHRAFQLRKNIAAFISAASAAADKKAAEEAPEAEAPAVLAPEEKAPEVAQRHAKLCMAPEVAQRHAKLCMDVSGLIKKGEFGDIALCDSTLEEQVGCMDATVPRGMYAEHVMAPLAARDAAAANAADAVGAASASGAAGADAASAAPAGASCQQDPGAPVWPPVVGSVLTARYNQAAKWKNATVTAVEGARVFVIFAGYSDVSEILSENVSNSAAHNIQVANTNPAAHTCADRKRSIDTADGKACRHPEG